MKQATRNKITLAIVLILAAYIVHIMSPTQSAKQLVLTELKDPESAQFKDIKTMHSHICGAVNSKNSFGGYTGFKRFIYIKESGSGLTGRLIWEDHDPAKFGEFLVKCLEKGR